MLTIEINRALDFHPRDAAQGTRRYDYVVKHDGATITYGRVEHDPMIGWEALLDRILAKERCDGND